MNPTAERLRERVKEFATRIVRFARTLPRDPVSDVLARQLVRSGTSVSANYRATCRARSRAEFVAKLGVVLEEADETEHWLDVLTDSHVATGEELRQLRLESREIRAIFAASVATSRANRKSQNP